LSTITAGQIRAARGLLGWSQADLAKAAEVGRATIADFESGRRAPYTRTIDLLRAALEAAGVAFIAENGGGAGVRLLKAPAGPGSISVEDLNASNDE
jgi:transcriptional regulator with XRE-family HTH domain